MSRFVRYERDNTKIMEEARAAAGRIWTSWQITECGPAPEGAETARAGDDGVVMDAASLALAQGDAVAAFKLLEGLARLIQLGE